MSTIGQVLYRILENVDGEKGLTLLAYKSAQRIKVFLLREWIK